LLQHVIGARAEAGFVAQAEKVVPRANSIERAAIKEQPLPANRQIQRCAVFLIQACGNAGGNAELAFWAQKIVVVIAQSQGDSGAGTEAAENRLESSLVLS